MNLKYFKKHHSHNYPSFNVPLQFNQSWCIYLIPPDEGYIPTEPWYKCAVFRVDVDGKSLFIVRHDSKYRMSAKFRRMKLWLMENNYNYISAIYSFGDIIHN